MEVFTGTGGEALGGGIAIFLAIVGGMIALALLVLLVAAVISILVHKNLTAGGKLLWVLWVLYLPIIGSVAWFVMGRKGAFNRLLGIDKGGRHEVPAQGHHSKETSAGQPPTGSGQPGDMSYGMGATRA